MQTYANLAATHTYCLRDQLEQGLEADVLHPYTLGSYKNLYGRTVTPQYTYGNEPHRPPAKREYSCEGRRQGDAQTTVYFNVLAAKVYSEQLV